MPAGNHGTCSYIHKKKIVLDNEIKNNLTLLIEATCKLEETFGVTLTLMILFLNEEGKFV